MSTYVRYNPDKSIASVANWPAPGMVQVDFEVVRGYDGRLYKAGEEPQKTPEQERAEQVATERARLCAELEALDAKGARAARAVALAVAKGEQVNAADMEKLALIEEAASALRAEMGAL